MRIHDTHSLRRNLPCLRIREQTTEADAEACIRTLADLEACRVGIVRFEGETPWEWHPDDELLFVFEGRVRVELEGGGEPSTMGPGSLTVVPRRTWHRQVGEGVTLLFATSREGNRSASEPGRGPAETA